MTIQDDDPREAFARAQAEYLAASERLCEWEAEQDAAERRENMTGGLDPTDPGDTFDPHALLAQIRAERQR